MFKPTCECSVQSDAAHTHVMQRREPMLLQATPASCHAGGTHHALQFTQAHQHANPTQTLPAAGRC
jgi:hypothetical protein